MKSPVSLTAKLVATAVLLVAVVVALIASAATLALHSYLSDRLDRDVVASVGRLPHDGDTPPVNPPEGDGDRDNTWADRQRVGTLTGLIGGPGSHGEVSTESDYEKLSAASIVALEALPTDGRPRDVTLTNTEGDSLGEYRAATAVASFGTVVAGLPTSSVDGPVSSLVLWEALFGGLGIVVAAGAGRFVVRRQLRPLREVASTAHAVAELPLATGAIDLTERVPAHLTDERTEVGQVGSALNTLLAHVESSLDARHRSEQQVRQFVADASHELRTPLATITGYTELARRRPDDGDTARTALTKVEEESARMTSLVEDLLLLARLDAGRPLERENVDVSRLLIEAVSDARVVAPGHTWRLDLPESSVEVMGDEQRLHQVVTNLLTNARKYTPAGTTVTVRADEAGFAVHDDGPGFPPELASHAFERFARGDLSRTRGPQGGAGLGLALVQAIVTSHGGRVMLSSQPGDTTLRVRLAPV
ncbi:MAG: sensor histidine kinase [Nocardioides sp.]